MYPFLSRFAFLAVLVCWLALLGNPQALAAPAAASRHDNADAVFAWAEKQYPQLFAPAGAASQSLSGYWVRYYKSTSSYLGVNESGVPKLYYLGPASGGKVAALGELTTWLTQAKATSSTSTSTSTTTPSAPSTTTAWRFAMVGDTHVPILDSIGSANIFSEIVTSMISDGVKVALLAGDIVDAGAGVTASEFAAQLDAWKKLAAPLYDAGIGVYSIRGNHEADVKKSLEVWNAAFAGDYLLPANGPSGESNLTYSFVYKNALFVGLDNYLNLHQVNQSWLDQQLAGNSHPHVFAFGHEAAFKVFHSDNLDNQMAARDSFWKSLTAGGARVYLCGHDHLFDVARIDDGDNNAANDLYQFLVGTGNNEYHTKYNYNGANSTYTPVNVKHINSSNGYLLVEVSGEADSDLGVTLTYKQRTVASNGSVSYQPTYSMSYNAAAKASTGTTTPSKTPTVSLPYAIVDSAQKATYNSLAEITAPAAGAAFYGQDAQYSGLQPSYKDNGDGTVSDLNTGLMWVKARGAAQTWEASSSGAATSKVGGYSDWRMPTIKELYSLALFSGAQGASLTSSKGYIPFIDTAYFDFVYGPGTSTTTGERIIDSQDWSSNVYVGNAMNGQSVAFGYNFGDGRIKGYPLTSAKYVRYVRGNASYGTNAYQDNGDGTISDAATGLMWAQDDSGAGLNWQAALAWVQEKNAAKYLGHTDWRLPNVKELQSIVDYSRAPDAADSSKRGPAIDPIFRTTAIVNEGGATDYPFYWSSTSFMDGTQGSVPAAYVAFGRALGYMPVKSGVYQLMDVHGAGAQRSDPKDGKVSDYLIGNDAKGNPVYGRGPQGDVVRISNYVRLVRDAK